jgi:uncharacterized protein (TIGR02996 family)
MDTEAGLLVALHADPADRTAWLALGDWLEEHGELERAELLRLHLGLRADGAGTGRLEREGRVRELLEGVEPCWPTLTNSLGMRFSLVPPGRFRMGSDGREWNRDADEGPVHEVEITRAFYLGVHQVTQEQYARVTGLSPSDFSATGRNRDQVPGLDTRSFPVEMVSWEEAVSFCARLSRLPGERAAGRVYRLPSEAEWEYACRGAMSSSAPVQYGTSLCSTQANFDGNYPYGGARPGPYLERPTPVGSYRPNVLGLYDMAGNIWEWCNDWYGAGYYAVSPARDPAGPAEGERRVVRGGCWFSPGVNCRIANRNSDHPPTNRTDKLGFRVALAGGVKLAGGSG